MDTSLEQSIFNSVSYFDIFDYPLTHFELYSFLFSEEKKRYSFVEVKNCLQESSVLQEKLFFRDGFIGKVSREALISERQKRYIISHDKFRKVRRFAKLAKHLPFVELIAACNNLSFYNAKKESDLDFFIVAKKDMVSVVRLFTVLVSIIFFRRPSNSHHEDAICLSFFVDSNHQNMSNLSLPTRDIYMQYWYETLQPLFMRNKMVYTSIEKENKEVLSFFPNHYSRLSTVLTEIGISRTRSSIEFLWRALHLDFLASWLYSFQIKHLPVTISSAMNASTSVIITSSIFKTHSKDIRESIYERWTQGKNL